MDRLTDKDTLKVAFDTWELCGIDHECQRDCRKPTPCKIPQIITRLANYEDLEEQGRLIKLPCKVGDTIYKQTCKGVAEYTVYAIIIDQLGIFLKIKRKRYDELTHAVVIDHSWNIGKLGEELFLTKEDAEAKLKEVQNG